jgi:uncharacterized protein
MKKLFLLFIVFILSTFIFAQPKFDVEQLLKQKPSQEKLVNDFSGILTADQKYSLEQKLIALDDNTSTQIAVVIVPSLGDNDISDFNVKLLRFWGVGGKKNNNGVVLLICTDPDNRKLNIATGYGVEGALPDVTCKHIIDDDIIPSFKGKDYFRGIDNGVNSIVKAVQGEYNVKRDKSAGGGSSMLFFIIILLIFFFLMSRRGGGGGGAYMSRRGQRGIADAIFWNTVLGGGGGGWNGGGGSGGWSDGGGGGGFGGFGGGSGGGGGASGSW